MCLCVSSSISQDWLNTRQRQPRVVHGIDRGFDGGSTIATDYVPEARQHTAEKFVPSSLCRPALWRWISDAIQPGRSCPPVYQGCPVILGDRDGILVLPSYVKPRRLLHAFRQSGESFPVFQL
jgi:hypothetical protein